MKTRVQILIAALLSAGASSAALADEVPQPLISPEDGGTDAFLARYSVRASLALARITTADATAGVYSFQGFVGPWRDAGIANTSFRFRVTAVTASDTDHPMGPFTLAIQHYFPIEPFFSAPLLGLHFGVEGAMSTPWLSGRKATPPAALRIVGLESELAGNGWDFRPSGWVRLDFLACRSLYFEAGGGPDFFAPTDGAYLVALRYHVALGFDMGCDHRDLSQIARPGLIFEYRARGVLYAGANNPYYDDLLSGTLQWVLGPVTIGLTYGTDPSFGARMIGARLQTGAVETR